MCVCACAEFTVYAHPLTHAVAILNLSLFMVRLVALRTACTLSWVIVPPRAAMRVPWMGISWEDAGSFNLFKGSKGVYVF